MRRKRFIPCLILVFLTISVMAEGDSSSIINKDSNGIALKGHDPVAYFAAGEVVEGKKEFEYEWKGAKWRFSTVANRDLFSGNPDKYAPQYGGYCAYGVSRGYLAPIDPKAWKVLDGKLYLNYDKEVQATWVKDTKGYIKKANELWPEVSKTKPLE